MWMVGGKWRRRWRRRRRQRRPQPNPLRPSTPPPSIPNTPPQRDDLSGCDLSGNKVRKLEFLIADALAQGADTLVTVGAIQSNHARATAVAARYAGLDCHLVLRAPDAEADPGLTGNLMVSRLAGAHLHLVTVAEYARVGAPALTQCLADRLAAQGRRPYIIPLGGSNSLGSWGYLHAADELAQQAGDRPWDDVVVACGSGGTVAGLALGCRLSGSGTRVVAYGVCDTPSYFWGVVDEHWAGLGAGAGTPRAVAARDAVEIVQARGRGYAESTPAELDTVRRTALTTGVITDGVYTGKALHAWLAEVAARPDRWRGRKVCFLHTGGLLGMYGQAGALEPDVQALGRVSRMHV